MAAVCVCEFKRMILRCVRCASECEMRDASIPHLRRKVPHPHVVAVIAACRRHTGVDDHHLAARIDDERTVREKRARKREREIERERYRDRESERATTRKRQIDIRTRDRERDNSTRHMSF